MRLYSCGSAVLRVPSAPLNLQTKCPHPSHGLTAYLLLSLISMLHKSPVDELTCTSILSSVTGRLISLNVCTVHTFKNIKTPLQLFFGIYFHSSVQFLGEVFLIAVFMFVFPLDELRSFSDTVLHFIQISRSLLRSFARCETNQSFWQYHSFH